MSAAVGSQSASTWNAIATLTVSSWVGARLGVWVGSGVGASVVETVSTGCDKFAPSASIKGRVEQSHVTALGL